MRYNPNPEANKQVLDFLAEIGRPVSHQEVADHLRITPQTAHKRLQRLRLDKLVARVRYEIGGALFWRLDQTKSKTPDGFTRHSPVTALPPLEHVVRRWLRKVPVQGGLNGR